MTTINLKDFYPWYMEDQFIEVSDAVADELRASRKAEAAHQRQLTRNAIYAAGRIDFIRPEGGESPYALQPFARKTEKDMTR